MFEKLKRYMARRKAEVRRDREGVALASDHGPRPVGFVVASRRPVILGTEQPVGPWEDIPLRDNLVVTQAEQLMAQMAIAAANSALSYIELGDPTAPANVPALTNTTLQQTTGQRKTVTLTASGNVVTATATWAAGEGNGFTYTEAGLYTGVLGAGSLFARKTFAGITKTAAFQLKFTWYTTFLVNTQGGDLTGVSFIGPASVSMDTVYVATGLEASVAATFDFTVGAKNIDVFLNGVRLVPGVHYTEAAVLTAPVGGPASNKGVNLVGFTLAVGDRVFLIQRTLT